MVELLDSPFQPLQIYAKFDALEELFIQIPARRVGLIDQPSAENNFLSEKPECTCWTNAEDVLNHSSDSIGYYVAKPLSSESVES